MFGCFVDFQKAFDMIPRSLLFQKLLDNNINGNFYKCLVNLYIEDKACVKVGNKITPCFQRTQGVKQGCILSPLLFNIFLSDLQDKIERKENCPVELAQGQSLGCIIWADDILLLTKSEIGLKNMLETLKNYTEHNGMSINTEKTEVMIFNKTGRHIRKNFVYGDQTISTTRQYKYLGFLVTPSGEINSGLKDLKARAMRAFVKIRKQTGVLFQKYPLVSLKLFEALIKPILLYASDFWGILKLPNNNPLEIMQQSFYKQLLGVQKQTTNVGVLLEMGEVSLDIYAKTMAIKNWSRIAIQKKANELVIKSYGFAEIQNLTWVTQIKNTLSEIRMRESFINSDDCNIQKKVFQRMCDIFHQGAFEQINKENSKLRTYKLIKTNIGRELYLEKIENIENRISFTKFRLSNHSLMIEKGRHCGITKDMRFCPFCPQIIEDEIHFLIECKCFEIHRNELFDKVNINNFRGKNKTDKYFDLMTNIEIIPLTADYLRRTQWVRHYLLENHKNYN